MVGGNREVDYNSELEPGQTKYSFTEWQEEIYATVVGVLTDIYEYNQDILMNLGEHDCYFITLTPMVPEVTYSYIQYVFDQGVYTVVGGEGSAQKFIDVYTYPDGSESSIDFTMQVDVDGLQTFEDIFNYLETKGFIRDRYGEIGTYPVVGEYNGQAVVGLKAEYQAQEEAEDRPKLTIVYLNNGYLNYQGIFADDSSWITTITYLGQENNE